MILKVRTLKGELSRVTSSDPRLLLETLGESKCGNWLRDAYHDLSYCTPTVKDSIVPMALYGGGRCMRCTTPQPSKVGRSLHSMLAVFENPLETLRFQR